MNKSNATASKESEKTVRDMVKVRPCLFTSTVHLPDFCFGFIVFLSFPNFYFFVFFYDDKTSDT